MQSSKRKTKVGLVGVIILATTGWYHNHNNLLVWCLCILCPPPPQWCVYTGIYIYIYIYIHTMSAHEWKWLFKWFSNQILWVGSTPTHQVLLRWLGMLIGSFTYIDHLGGKKLYMHQKLWWNLFYFHFKQYDRRRCECNVNVSNVSSASLAMTIFTMNSMTASSNLLLLE